MKQAGSWSVWLACLLFLLLPASARALAPSGINGVVVDRNGTPLPGVTVTVSDGARGMAPRGTVTDSRGQYRIVPLPPGPGYTLRVSFPGLATVTLSEIAVEPGRLTAVPVQLRPESEVKERVRVVGRTDIVDTTSTTLHTDFSAEFIDALPILGRNYQGLLTLAPGVTDVDGTGNPNIHGARDTDVITLVDGVSTVDPLTGHAGQQLNIESIQELEIKTSGASAEFSRGQGGFVNILTKSGGNEFQGTFKFYWRGDRLDGDGAGIDDPGLHGGLGEVGLRDLTFNDYLPFLSLGGPIRKDKAWYFVTAEYIQQQEPINALTQSFVRGTREMRVFGKASWDVSANHKLVLSATLDPQEYTNQGLDSSTAIESGYTSREGGRNLVLKETSIFSPDVFLETTVQSFHASPRRIATLDPDSNGNGILYDDRNHNGFYEAAERDPGDDYDGDGAWDVYEEPFAVGVPGQERDKDHDLRRTAPLGCEGRTREDRNCNGILDPGEDRNGNGVLDDRPFPSSQDLITQHLPDGTEVPLPAYYPYERFVPLPADRDSTTDLARGLTTGPNPLGFDRDTRRITLRQDLTLFVADWQGQHDLKLGGVVERESYAQSTSLRPIRYTIKAFTTPQTGVLLPTETEVRNDATGTTIGLYIQDTYKPRPNLTIGAGFRFDREATDSFGYTPVDPARERILYNRLYELSGGEFGGTGADISGDGLISRGFCTDPIFAGVGCPFSPSGNLVIADLARLALIAPSRLTQHHFGTSLLAQQLKGLFPDVVTIDPVTQQATIDRDALRRAGAATFQDREPLRLTNNNLSPRLFVSWDPFADSRTKIFANWSRLYDKLFLATVVPEEGPDTIFRYYQLDRDGVAGNGTPDSHIGNALSKAPPGYTQVDRGLQTPFADEFTFGFEREIAPEVSFRATYINRKYRRQLQDRDINHYVRYDENGRPIDNIGKINVSRAGVPQPSPDGRPDLYIRNFFFNQILEIGNFDEARYHAIELQVVRRLSRKWQMDASYTYSRAIGNAENYQSELGNDPSLLQDEFGYLDYDQRHQVKLNAVTYLPGRVTLSGTLSWSSGLPYSIIDRFVAADDFGYFQSRTLYGFPSPTGGADGGPTFVQLRRNPLRNAAVYDINLRLQRDLLLSRLGSRLFLSVDNLLNTDDLRIRTTTPDAADRGGVVQLNSQRRFGRRFEVGFQVDF